VQCGISVFHELQNAFHEVVKVSQDIDKSNEKFSHNKRI